MPHLKQSTKSAVKATLSETERNVLSGLVRYPELNDTQLATKIPVSRQTINTLRHRLIKEGWIRPAVIPDIQQLGFELIALTHMTYSPKAPMKKREKEFELIRSQPHHLLHITQEFESLDISLFQHYNEFQQNHNQLLKLYEKYQYLNADPTIHVVQVSSLKNIEFHAFSSLMDKLAGSGKTT